MCLDKLKPVSTKKGYGWKVFDKWDSKLESRYFDIRYPTNKWIKDKKSKPIQGDRVCYPTGFHVFVSKEKAKDWGGIVRKVYYKNVVATGLQNIGFWENICAQVIVAKEIWIEETK